MAVLLGTAQVCVCGSEINLSRSCGQTRKAFRDAFRRWPLTLTSVKAGDLDQAVYAAVEPGVVARADGQGGYQAVRFTLKPQTTTARPKPEEPSRPSRVATSLLIEPMPILI